MRAEAEQLVLGDGEGSLENGQWGEHSGCSVTRQGHAQRRDRSQVPRPAASRGESTSC